MTKAEIWQAPKCLLWVDSDLFAYIVTVFRYWVESGPLFTALKSPDAWSGSHGARGTPLSVSCLMLIDLYVGDLP
jgi:hypothetical protein